MRCESEVMWAGFPRGGNKDDVCDLTPNQPHPEPTSSPPGSTCHLQGCTELSRNLPSYRSRHLEQSFLPWNFCSQVQLHMLQMLLQSGLSFPVHFCHDPHPKKPVHYLLNGSFFSVAGKSYFRNYGVILIACTSALWKTAIAMTILP